MVEFHVLRCASCQTFQVLQVTKTSKWKCKMCGEKQSIIKVFGQGTGADCRKHVQKLNSIQGCITQELQQHCLATALSVSALTNTAVDSGMMQRDHLPNTNTSRWEHFLDNGDDPKHAIECEISPLDSHVTTDYNEFLNNKKRKRQETQKTYNKWTKYSNGESSKNNPQMNYSYKNTHHNFSQDTRSSSSLGSHDRPKGTHQINLSGCSKTTGSSEVSTSLPCNTNKPLSQVPHSEPKKLYGLLDCSGGASQSDPLSQRTEHSTLSKAISSDSVQMSSAKRNSRVSSLKWADFLEYDDEEEDEELCGDEVSGPVFVTSLNKLSQVDNVLEDEF